MSLYALVPSLEYNGVPDQRIAKCDYLHFWCQHNCVLAGVEQVSLPVLHSDSSNCVRFSFAPEYCLHFALCVVLLPFPFFVPLLEKNKGKDLLHPTK
jgi:hypothetical protein